MHDASDIAVAKRAAGRRLGGQSRMKPRPFLAVVELPPAQEITSLTALSKVLSKALQGVLTGLVDSKTAHAAAALAGPLLKTLAMAEGVDDETERLPAAVAPPGDALKQPETCLEQRPASAEASRG